MDIRYLQPGPEACTGLAEKAASSGTFLQENSQLAERVNYAAIPWETMNGVLWRTRKGGKLCAFATVLAGAIAASTLAGCKAAEHATAPMVSGAVVGDREIVFDTRNGCEQIDIPDAPARAFRDGHGVIHLIATHYVARGMVGPSLNELKRDCHVIYRSPKDPNPSHFQDNNWIYSFYTEDGLRVAALVHSEYDADEIPGMCATPRDTNNCWWNTITYAESTDGGADFAMPAPPKNLVAALPYRYEMGNHTGAHGYYMPSNILKVGGFFYALVDAWPYREQQYGACLIRTADVFAPSSWRAWDGKDFTVEFADPYLPESGKPGERICHPVMAGEAHSLVEHLPSGNFIATQFAPDDRFGGPAGFYLQASRDLIHWSTATLLVSFKDLEATDGPGQWSYNYESLLDPGSEDRNFATVSNMPYLYYVRSDGEHAPYSRVLFRRRIRVEMGK